jgi:hypothetical protein
LCYLTQVIDLFKERKPLVANKRILVVTKDMAEFGLYQALTRLLRAAGHEVIVVAEGLSLGKWLEAGEEIFSGKPAEDLWDAVHGFRLDIKASEVLGALIPDLVLTGIAFPINLGESFGLAANGMGIKLGFVNDLWGVERHTRAIPNFICTIDPLGRKMIEENPAYSERVPQVYVTGSPLLDRLFDVRKNAHLGKIIDGRRPVVFLVGQDESTTPVIEGMMKVLDKLGEDCILIPRLHPKLMEKDFVGPWLRALARCPVEVLWVPPSKATTQEIIQNADYTVSIFSNALLEAATLGSLPISWNSDIGRQSMQSGMGGLEQFPSVGYGCAIEVNSPEEFLEKVPVVGSQGYLDVLNRCLEVFPNDGGATNRVFRAIEEQLV